MSIRSVRFFYPAATGPAPEELVINVSQVIGPNAQLELPVGLKGSINLWQVNKRYITLGQPDTIAVPVDCVASVRRAHRLLVDWLCDGNDSMIKLTSVSPGYSPKSKRVQVDGVIYLLPSRRHHQGAEYESHELIVPTSMLHQKDGDQFLPKWFLRKAIHEHVHHGKRWPDDIVGGRFMSADKLWSELFQEFEDRVKSSSCG